jgi:hypothetical protein
MSRSPNSVMDSGTIFVTGSAGVGRYLLLRAIERQIVTARWDAHGA